MNGTSMAAPHVSGTVALMLEKNPTLQPSEVKNILENTAEDLGFIGRDNDYGSGRINAYNAVFGKTQGMIANFSATPSSRDTPLSISFTDTSVGSPTSWYWDFGDRGNSTERNPMHTYSSAGNYTVSLIVSNANGTATKTSEINVKSASHTGPYAYITSNYSNIVSVIDTATNNITATIPVGIDPFGVAVTPDGSKVYVSNNVSNTISVIDTSTNRVIATITVGSHPHGVAVTPDGKKVYVANTFDNTTSLIDAATNSVIATVPVVESYPYGVAVTPDGTKVYVTSSTYIENSTYNSTVSIIDNITNKVTATVKVGTAS
jgi:YVTN family beta-propeller protein